MLKFKKCTLQQYIFNTQFIRNHTTTSCYNYHFHYLRNSRTNDNRWKGVDLEGEYIRTDVVVVGGGVAGLSTAIKLAQLSKQTNLSMEICLLEKASYFGGHIISGACFDPTILNQLTPDWKNKFSNVNFTKVTDEKLNFLTENKSISLLKNGLFNCEGATIVSLGELVKGMADYAESLNVNLYNGVGVNEIVYNCDGSVGGVRVGDTGIHKDGSPKGHFERGLAIKSRFTVLAEGCRGSITKEVIKEFNLSNHSSPPSYSLGLKEVWAVDSRNHVNGLVEHNLGFPLNSDTYGGSFVYHYLDEEPLVSLGLIVGLNYKNPYLNPYEELQRLKTHPKFRELLEKGKRISYGARTINKGGFQALPRLSFPGGWIVGCGGGLLNPATLKGIHNAIASGIMAAEAIFQAISSKFKETIVTNYEDMFKSSHIYLELKATRNFRPSFDTTLGMYGTMFYAGAVWPLTRGHEPFTITPTKHDHEYLKPAKSCAKISYPKPDNNLTFDLMSSVALTNTQHEVDQPSHLILSDDSVPCKISLNIFDGPEQRYCPAGVYEFVDDPHNPSNKILQINAQNCIHCKTCDIKDPSQNINWVVPENGGGPNYSGL